jgi:serine/threonine-protein kinase
VAPSTKPGVLVGTPNYMSPEQVKSSAITPRADLFSAGVVLFELITGRLPFEGSTATEIIDHILHQDPPPVSRYVSGVPLALDGIVKRTLEKSPAFRYQSARELYNDL